MAKEDYIYLEFSIPPSINECFTGYPKRVKSQVYKDWTKKAELELLTQTRYKLTGNEWLMIQLEYYLPLYYKNGKKRKVDLDNRLKPTLDLLVNNIEGLEDEHIKKIIATKIDSDQNIVKLKIYELTN